MSYKKTCASKILERYGSLKCIWCDIVLNKNNITMDHVIPWGFNGKCIEHNRRPCCSDCNHSRAILTSILASAKNTKPKTALKKLEERKRLAEQWAKKEKEKLGFSVSDKIFAEYLAILGTST